MTALRTTRPVRAGLAATAVVLALGGLTGCQFGSKGADTPAPVAASTTAASQAPFDSQFTQDGTFQSHLSVPGAPQLDFVYTLYPTKSTPRTNEWYPTGNKYFSFTFQAYDLSQDIRAPFASKRKVYLQHIAVTSATVTSAGGATQQPYSLDSDAAKITFDPEPVTTARGMLITSPKGAFELRNQAIGDVSADTRGINLTFTATVWVQTKAGGTQFVKRTVKQVVPIAIFSSSKPTSAQSIPVDAN